MPLRFPNFSATILLVAVSVCSSSLACGGETISDDDLGFVLALPDDFVTRPDVVEANPDIVHGFALGDPTDDQVDILLVIERMHGVLDRERLKPEHLPPGFQGRLFTTTWHGFEVDSFEVPEQLGDVATLTYNVQIPLKHEAIQVKLFGPADRESELRRLLSETLDGLEGESNWIPSAIVSPTLDSSPRYGFALIAAAVVIVLGGLVALWFVSRKLPPRNPAILMCAAGIWITGMMLSDIRVREIILLSGSFKMLGVGAGILGIIDLIRKRKRAQPASKNRGVPNGPNKTP